MHISDLNGKNICILGFGREGQAMLRALEKYAPTAKVTIADQNQELIIEKYKTQLGQNFLKSLARFDLIIKSPGIPPNDELKALGNKLTSSTQIFLDTVKEKGALVIGVTGSKGKSTTSSLIYDILRAARKDAYLVGNIGEAAIDHLDKAAPGTIFVLEMSSYQLMNLTTSPQIAVITSFFPEHLDYHGTVAAYKEAKKHITRFQKKGDTVFYSGDFFEAKEIANESKGKKVAFSALDAPMGIDTTRLRGTHNLSNIAGACAVAAHLNVDRKTIMDTCRAFKGLPHRLQSLGKWLGIEWIDDAISTTPESTIAALDALGDKVSTIILGGQDRGNDFTKLAKRFIRSGVETVILFPGSGPRIRESLENAKVKVKFFDADSMEAAVKIAKAQTPAGTICLLSTASPSYGMFKNFEEKGDAFRTCIHL